MLIVVPQLFSDLCPRTSRNFEALCTGEQGLTKSGVPLCYKDSLFHRVVPNGWVQGGGRHLSKAVQNTNNPWCNCYMQIPHRNPLTPRGFKADGWEATEQVMPLTCSVAILVHGDTLKDLDVQIDLNITERVFQTFFQKGKETGVNPSMDQHLKVKY